MPAPTRAPWDQPFAADSFWNAGIGADAQWDTTSAAAQTLHSLTGVINDTDWSLPSFAGTASDPLVTVSDQESETPVGPQEVHIPLDAQPSGGTDKNMVFYDVTQPETVWSGWNAQFNNGSNVAGGVTFGLESSYSTTGEGVDSLQGGPTNYNYAGGVVTNYDLSQSAIDHMLRISISPDALQMPNGSSYYESGIPWPNQQVDGNGPTLYTGGASGIPAGDSFGIPANVDLSTLGLSAGGLMLATALQDYGAVWKDSGGTDQFTAYADPSTASSPLMQQMTADMQKLMPYLAILTSQGPTTVNGGGAHPYEVTTPLAAAGLTTANAPPPLDAGQAASASGTTIQPGQTLVDASGNAWSIYNGAVEVNDMLDSSTSNVTEMAYVNGQVYEESGTAWSALTSMTAGWAAASDPLPTSGSGGTTPIPTPPPSVTSSQDLSVAVPGNEIVRSGGTVAISGVSITDPWASTAGGTMALNVYDSLGSISIAGHTYGPGGGKVANGMIQGTEAQLNADLASMTYTAGTGAGTDTLYVDVWNQAGVEITQAIPITVTAPSIPVLGVTLPTATPKTYTGVPIKLGGVTVSDSNAAETATLHVTATSGTLTMANASNNAIAGSGTGTISVSDTVVNLNSDLSHLTFQGTAAGTAGVSVGLTDAAGASASKSESVMVSADTLTLTLSEDKYLGNAEFIAKVNGKQVGGPTAVTALHSSGATQKFTFTGEWGAGASVEIDFINDKYRGTPQTDRNLYVDQVTYNGATALTATHPLWSNGGFTVSAGQ